MKKKFLLSASACIIATSFLNVLSADAYSSLTDYILGNGEYTINYDVDVDWSFWDDFIKYDLRITDYDSLPEKKKELCKFIYETEISSKEDIVCERARRIIAGYDVGERVSPEICSKYERIADYSWDYTQLDSTYISEEEFDYSYANKGKFTLHCVPDIKHVGEENYNEYWLDDAGTERIEAVGEGTGFVYDRFCGTYKYINDKGESEKMPFANDFTYQTIRQDGFEYIIYPDNTLCLSKITDNNSIEISNGKLFIPNEINNMPVTRIGSGAFDTLIEVDTIYLPETLKYIEPLAFRNCYYLENINFPKGLEFIGSYAFWNCKSLKNLEINCPNLKNKSYIFGNCNIKSLSVNTKSVPYYPISSTVPYYPDSNTFGSITFGKGVKEIDVNYLKNDYDIPQNIKILSNRTYDDLKNLKIPEHIEIFGAFREILPTYFGSGLNSIPEIPLIDVDYCAVNPECTIEGYYNTEAHKYAVAHNLKFNALDDISYGDTNGDGNIDIADAVVLQKYLLGNGSTGFEADMNRDGIIDVFDMIEMRKKLIENF